MKHDFMISEHEKVMSVEAKPILQGVSQFTGGRGAHQNIFHDKP